jgi:hypothetical protein
MTTCSMYVKSPPETLLGSVKLQLKGVSRLVRFYLFCNHNEQELNTSGFERCIDYLATKLLLFYKAQYLP